VLWQTAAYAFDGAGNVTAGPGSFRYDLVGRLIDGTVTTALGGRIQCMSYDAFGNITGQAVVPNGSICTPSPITIDPATNQLASPSLYDDAGRMTVWGSGKVQYNYYWYPTDQMRQMNGSMRTTYYAYGADGERLAWNDSAEGGVHYTLRDLDGKPIREFYENQGTWSWRKDYVWRDGSLLAVIDPNGVKHAHLDHLGSVRRFTDPQGNVVLSRDYLPFGQLEGPANTSERIGFTGHERDHREPSGTTDDLDYMHARHYNLNLGRFLSPDPLRGNPHSPQSFNLYAYVQSNPINLIDPLGLLPDDGDPVPEPAPCPPDEEGKTCFSSQITVVEPQPPALEPAEIPLPESWQEFLEQSKQLARVTAAAHGIPVRRAQAATATTSPITSSKGCLEPWERALALAFEGSVGAEVAEAGAIIAKTGGGLIVSGTMTAETGVGPVVGWGVGGFLVTIGVPTAGAGVALVADALGAIDLGIMPPPCQ
jgi:RHS repeat-associated protein